MLELALESPLFGLKCLHNRAEVVHFFLEAADLLEEVGLSVGLFAEVIQLILELMSESDADK